MWVDTVLPEQLKWNVVGEDDYCSGQMKRNKGQGMWQGAWSSHALSLHLHVFTNWEALLILYIWDFMETSPQRQDQSLTPFSFLLSSQKNEGVGAGLKTLNF